MAKTNCPITRDAFRNNAQPVTLTVNGTEFLADVKEFKTGSLGWYLNGKTIVKIGETPVSVQMGVNLTIVGSKDLPQDKVSQPEEDSEAA